MKSQHAFSEYSKTQVGLWCDKQAWREYKESGQNYWRGVERLIFVNRFKIKSAAARLTQWVPDTVSRGRFPNYRQVSNIRRALAANEIIDPSEVVGASPGFNGLGKDDCNTKWESFKCWDLVRLVLEIVNILHEACPWRQVICAFRVFKIRIDIVML